MIFDSLTITALVVFIVAMGMFIHCCFIKSCVTDK